MDKTQGSRIKNTNKIHGLDYLKCISIILVVIWHVFEPWRLKEYNSWTYITDILSYNFILLAVPIFFQISLLLFYLKRSDEENYLKRRLPKLFKIYIFWFFIYVICKIVESRFNYSFPQDIISLLGFIASAGGSLFYFLFSLIIITILAEFCWIFINKTSHQILIYSSLFIISCLFILLVTLNSVSLDKNFSSILIYWSPVNFIPYIFSGFLLFKALLISKQRNMLNNGNLLLIALLIISLLFAALEWRNLYNSSNSSPWGIFHLPVYSRLSLVFGSGALVFGCLIYKPRQLLTIKLISDYSLGIYCIHLFVKAPLEKIFEYIPIINDTFKNMIMLILIILISIQVTKFFRKSKLLKEMV